MKFGEYIKQRRLELNWKLRPFCRQIGYDPGNWNRIERGKSRAPKDPKFLELIREKLDIKDMELYYDLAAKTYLPREWEVE